MGRKRSDSDEAYVIDLCDVILQARAIRGHRFDFLRGDPTSNGRRGVPLPVDAYYPSLELVIEYMERQHTEAVAFFDRKHTVSGVSRGVQRALYDHRRAKVLPANGLKLIAVHYTELAHHVGSRRLKRNREHDVLQLRRLLRAAELSSSSDCSSS